MLRHIEIDEPLDDRAAAARPAHASGIAAGAHHVDAERGLLPRGHPKWVQDGVSLSQRARDALTRLRPIAIHVLRFWDHRLHAILIGGRRVRVDPSGSYRVE